MESMDVDEPQPTDAPRLTKEQKKARLQAAIDMRSAGQGYETIAQTLGWNSRQAAFKAVTEELSRRAASIDVTAARQTEIERLERLIRKHEDIIDKRHAVLFQGEDTGHDDDGPIQTSLNAIKALSERMSKLQGLDAPVRTAVEGAIRYEIVGVDPGDVT